jgi:hypothetical protein
VVHVNVVDLRAWGGNTGSVESLDTNQLVELAGVEVLSVNALAPPAWSDGAEATVVVKAWVVMCPR